MMNKTLIVSNDIYKESEETLLNLGYTLLKIMRNDWMEQAVSSHPDMYMTDINSRILYDSNVAHLFDGVVPSKKLIKCNRGVDKQKCIGHPYNIGFNCVNIGNKLICNRKHTCQDVLEFAESMNCEIINVNQGYAKCSTCVIDDNAIITEDISIAKCAEQKGIDVLLIEKGFVRLTGYDYGFIGGSCGMINDNTLAFNGNIKFHPNCKSIEEFCSNHSVIILNLCDRELYDIGSIFII